MHKLLVGMDVAEMRQLPRETKIWAVIAFIVCQCMTVFGLTMGILIHQPWGWAVFSILCVLYTSNLLFKGLLSLEGEEL